MHNLLFDNYNTEIKDAKTSHLYRSEDLVCILTLPIPASRCTNK